MCFKWVAQPPASQPKERMTMTLANLDMIQELARLSSQRSRSTLEREEPFLQR